MFCFLAVMIANVCSILLREHLMFRPKNNRVVPGDRSTYRGTQGNYVRFYHDASVDRDGNAGAFADLAAAIERAEEFIFIVGWSFHPDSIFSERSLRGALDKCYSKR